MFGDGYFKASSGEPLTEDQIERVVERRTDSVDRQYMAGKLTEDQYTVEMNNIRDWADAQYKKLPRSY